MAKSLPRLRRQREGWDNADVRCFPLLLLCACVPALEEECVRDSQCGPDEICGVAGLCLPRDGEDDARASDARPAPDRVLEDEGLPGADVALDLGQPVPDQGVDAQPVDAAADAAVDAAAAVDAGPDVLIDVPDGCVPAEETCDGLDEDCDGRADEALDPRHCGESICGDPLLERCVEGRWLCEEPEVPGEICNGLDDDCDGLFDEEAPCPGGPHGRGVCLGELGCELHCEGAFHDLDEVAANGCERGCGPPAAGPTIIANGMLPSDGVAIAAEGGAVAVAYTRGEALHLWRSGVGSVELAPGARYSSPALVRVGGGWMVVAKAIFVGDREVEVTGIAGVLVPDGQAHTVRYVQLADPGDPAVGTDGEAAYVFVSATGAGGGLVDRHQPYVVSFERQDAAVVRRLSDEVVSPYRPAAVAIGGRTHGIFGRLNEDHESSTLLDFDRRGGVRERQFAVPISTDLVAVAVDGDALVATRAPVEGGLGVAWRHMAAVEDHTHSHQHPPSLSQAVALVASVDGPAAVLSSTTQPGLHHVAISGGASARNQLTEEGTFDFAAASTGEVTHLAWSQPSAARNQLLYQPRPCR